MTASHPPDGPPPALSDGPPSAPPALPDSPPPSAPAAPPDGPPSAPSDGQLSTPAVLREPEHQVSSRAVAYWRVSATLGWLVLFTIIGVVWWLWLDHLWWVLPATGVWAAYAVVQVIVMPRVRYRVHRWEVTPVAVRTRSGWLSREQRIAPLSRVQTVDSTQGAVMRLFGLASLTVTTASAAGPVTIECLDRDTAERLAAELTAVTGATPGDAT